MMITTLRVAIAVIVLALSLTTLAAGQRPAGQPAAPAPAPEVFCNTMQAGTLCPTGTVSILKLSGPKVQPGLDAVNKYNGAVENATKQLKAEAKSVLTPAQLTELDRWLEKGINPEVNRILASRAAIQR